MRSLILQFFVLSLFVMSFYAFSQSKSKIQKISCSKEIFAIVDFFSPVGEWLDFKNGFGIQNKVHDTLEVYPLKKKTLVKLYSKNKIDTFEADEDQKCRLQIRSKQTKESFLSEYDFYSLLNKHPEGIVFYVWSPQMNLSIDEISKIHKNKIDRHIEVLLEPSADKKSSLKILKKYKLPKTYTNKIASGTLLETGILIHYPSMSLFKKNEFIKRIPGYNGVDNLKKIIKREL